MARTVAYETPDFRFTLDAAADLSAGQFKAVIVDANGDAARAAINGDIVGVQQNKPAAAGRACEIVQSGISKVVAGTGGITAGDQLSTDANGDFVTTPATVGVVPVAKCMVSAAAGEVGSALLLGTPGTINAGT